MKKFTTKQNRVLTEIYRRLNYFHGGNLDRNLLYLATPGEIKPIKELGLIEVHGRQTPRALNWYRLTKKGKDFFKNYVTENKLTEAENQSLFDGQVKEFDANLLPK